MENIAEDAFKTDGENAPEILPDIGTPELNASEVLPEIATPELNTGALSENVTDTDGSDDRAKALAEMWETLGIFLEEFKNLTIEDTSNSTGETVDEHESKRSKKKKTLLPVETPIETPVDVPLNITDPEIDAVPSAFEVPAEVVHIANEFPVDNATVTTPAVGDAVETLPTTIGAVLR